MRAPVQGAGPARSPRISPPTTPRDLTGPRRETAESGVRVRVDRDGKRRRSAVLLAHAEAALEEGPGPPGQIHDLGIEARDAVIRCQTLALQRRNPRPQRLRRAPRPAEVPLALLRSCSRNRFILLQSHRFHSPLEPGLVSWRVFKLLLAL